MVLCDTDNTNLVINSLGRNKENKRRMKSCTISRLHPTSRNLPKAGQTNNQNQSKGKSEASTIQDRPLPDNLQKVKDVMGERLVIGSPPKVERKGFQI
jgi:hypothetical protein